MEILTKQLAIILKISRVKLLAGLICLATWMLMPLPAAAIINNHAITPEILATMAQKMYPFRGRDAAAQHSTPDR